MNSLQIEQLPEFDNHKIVTFFSNEKAKLRAFVAVHNDDLGPATGGTRMWVYPSETDALRDVLNLSKAMTYKCALAGLPYGGSKGVIMGDPLRDKTPELLRAYAESFSSLGGVTTGTDVGLDDEDIKIMREVSDCILGVPDGDKLNTSITTALGVFSAIQGCAEIMWGKEGLWTKRFAIKGVGKTGLELLRLLDKEGAEVVVAEVDRHKVNYVKKNFPRVKFVESANIHKQQVDIYCPCALGADLNSESVKELRCKAIIGTANNQLATPDIGDWLHKSGIIYVPDYVANAGGLITVVDELEPDGYSKERVLERVGNIKQTVKKVLKRSRRNRSATSRVADKIAQEILKKGKRKKGGGGR